MTVVTYCDEPETLENGIVTLYGRMTGSVATYSCHDGYLLNGDPTRVCLGDGSWSGIDSTCTGEQPFTASEISAKYTANCTSLKRLGSFHYIIMSD